MAQRVEFEGQIHEFPEDFTEQEIASALAGSAAQTAPSGNADSITRDLVNKTPEPAARPAAPPWYAPQNPGRALKLGTQAIGSGLASVAGMPVDLMAGAQNLAAAGINKVTGASLPSVSKPVMGSDWIKDKAAGLFGAAGAPPIPKQDMAPAERMLYNIGDYGTQFVAQGGALAARAPKLAAEAVTGMRPAQGAGANLLDGMAAPYMENAGRTFAGDFAAGIGAGTGADMAQTYAPGSGLAEGAGVLGGAVGGSAIGAALQHLGKGVMNRMTPSTIDPVANSAGVGQMLAIDPNTGRPFSRGESESAARLLQEIASNPQTAARTISERASEFRGMDAPVPSVGLISGDLGLQAAESGMRARMPVPFVQRDNALRDAAGGKIDQFNQQFAGANPAALPARAGKFAEESVAPARSAFEQARASADAAVAENQKLAAPFTAMDTGLAREQASGKMQSAVEGPYKDWRAAKNQAFDQLDPDGTAMVDAGGVFRQAGMVRENINTLGPQGQQLPGEFLSALQKAEEQGGHMPLRDLVDVRKYLGTSRETARRTGNFKLADNIGALKGEINSTIDRTPEAAAANDLYKQGAERYRPNPNDPMAQWTRSMDRGNAPPASEFGNTMLGKPENADAFLRSVKGLETEPQAIEAAREYMRSGFAQTARSGEINPEAARQWISQNSAVLDRFPSIRNEFDTLTVGAEKGQFRAAEAGKAAKVAEQGVTDAQRAVDRGPAGALIGGKSPKELAANALSDSYGGERKLAEIKKMIGADKEAESALKQATAEVLTDKIMKVSRSGSGDALAGPKVEASLGEIEKLFNKNEKTLAQVYSPEEMNTLRQAHAILEPLKNAAMRATPGSQTADKMMSFWKVGEAALKLKFGMLKGGGYARSFRMLAETLPNNSEAVERLITAASFNPELAQMLLTKNVEQFSGALNNSRIAKLVGLEAALTPEQK